MSLRCDQAGQRQHNNIWKIDMRTFVRRVFDFLEGPFRFWECNVETPPHPAKRFEFAPAECRLMGLTGQCPSRPQDSGASNACLPHQTQRSLLEVEPSLPHSACPPWLVRWSADCRLWTKRVTADDLVGCNRMSAHAHAATPHACTVRLALRVAPHARPRPIMNI